MPTFDELTRQYYAQQPAHELAMGQACPRCGCHLAFPHHPACSAVELAEEAVKAAVLNSGGDQGQPWVFIGWMEPAAA